MNVEQRAANPKAGKMMAGLGALIISGSQA